MKTRWFKAVCVVLWGLQYQSPAARALGLARSSVVRYDNGERDIPDELLDKLYGLLIKHHGNVGKLIDTLADLRAGRPVKAATRKEAA